MVMVFGIVGHQCMMIVAQLYNDSHSLTLLLYQVESLNFKPQFNLAACSVKAQHSMYDRIHFQCFPFYLKAFSRALMHLCILHFVYTIHTQTHCECVWNVNRWQQRQQWHWIAIFLRPLFYVSLNSLNKKTLDHRVHGNTHFLFVGKYFSSTFLFLSIGQLLYLYGSSNMLYTDLHVYH